MEYFKPIKSGIKERLTNPLIFSFVCSWLVINWEIVLAIFNFNSSMIKDAGSKTVFDFIQSKITTQKSLVHPLIFAFLYTFFMPIIRNLIRVFTSYVDKRGETWNLKILKDGQMSIGDYILLKKEIDERSNLLMETVENEKTAQIENDQLKMQLKEYDSRFQQINIQTHNQQEKIFNFRNVKFLNGNWENSFHVEDDNTGRENIRIIDGKYFILQGNGLYNHIFNITDFFYDVDANTVFFVKELTPHEKQYRPSNEHISINQLKVQGNRILTGLENLNTRVTYTPTS